VVAYTVSKLSIQGLTKALSDEWAGKGLMETPCPPDILSLNLQVSCMEIQNDLK
jgi:NAD(P)-dependent dehydrogenase (short-subunit alcohol dehydrogenase family)